MMKTAIAILVLLATACAPLSDEEMAEIFSEQERICVNTGSVRGCFEGTKKDLCNAGICGLSDEDIDLAIEELMPNTPPRPPPPPTPK